MNNDQELFHEQLLPEMANLVNQNEDDAVLMARMMKYGPDPLCLLLSYGALSGWLGELSNLHPHKLEKAIRDAHIMGPGVLLDGGGLDPEMPKDLRDMSEKERMEMVWLLLAKNSATREGQGYSESTPLVKRVGTLGSCLWNLFSDIERGEMEFLAYQHIGAIQQEFTLYTTDLQGVSRCDPKGGAPSDYGFYVGYKEGCHCVVVPMDGIWFVGADRATLSDYGVIPDKQISDSFGIFFSKPSFLPQSQS